MPRLHVIFDPSDKIQGIPELERKLGIKTATLSINDIASAAEIAEMANKLAMMLMEQLFEGSVAA